MGVLDRFRLDGKRGFITGGSRGLGREMALGLAEAGADVVLVGRDATSLEATAADIRQRGRAAFAIQADVGIPAEAERACGRRSRGTARSTSSSTTSGAGAWTCRRRRCRSTPGSR